MATGKYNLTKASSGQFHWNLSASNGEKILSSELYTSKAGAQAGIASCRVNSPIDSRYDKRVAANGQYYFVLKAGNGEVIGTSESYVTTAGRDNGIEACKRYGPDSPVVDHTT